MYSRHWLSECRGIIYTAGCYTYSYFVTPCHPQYQPGGVTNFWAGNNAAAISCRVLQLLDYVYFFYENIKTIRKVFLFSD
jgi:hypothetical protein